MTTMIRTLRAPRGTSLTCRGWGQEAALRMLMNNLDPDVAERPEDLVVYGGTGKAARSWEAFDAIVRALEHLDGDETLLIQSGKPVGIFRTHAGAPRVLIANANLVPKWATWDTFRDLEDRGLTMYGQMTAGSWIYIGSQGIVQGTYETLAEIARRHFGGSLAGKIVVTAGLGGMGGAQPLAITMNGGVGLIVEVDPARIERRLATRYLDEQTDDVDDADPQGSRLRRTRRRAIDRAAGQRRRGAAAAGRARIRARRRHRPDVGSRSAGRLRARRAVAGGGRAGCARPIPPSTSVVPSPRWAGTSPRCARCSSAAPWSSTTATTSAPRPSKPASATRLRFPASSPRSSVRSSAKARDRFAGSRCQAIPKTSTSPTARPWRCSGDDEALCRWLRLAQDRVQFQGLPARICWLGYGDRARFGLKLNELVRTGAVKAPIVIGRDHLDTGSVASPNRETEGMRDGSDAIADWPILNALLNASAGATWVSLHHGGGVGIGYSIHAGMVIVADGSRDADQRLERVLTCDPGLGVVRHADAGYPEALATARRHGVRLPSQETGR